MSNNHEEELDPETMMVNINGKIVPFSSINKPHTVVINPKNRPQVDPNTFPAVESDARAKEAQNAILGQGQKPKIDPSTFPEVEPEAKAREAKLANNPDNIFLGQGQKPKVDPSTFPDIEPEAKAREAELAKKRSWDLEYN